MRRIRITVSYDGTDYHGWQVQPGVATIQRALEDVLSEIEGDAGRTGPARPIEPWETSPAEAAPGSVVRANSSRVHVDGSGRTDAGVHALAQVAAFRLANPIPLPNLKKAMNRLLPRDIRVLEAAEAHEGFHPRYEAIAKTYEYRILRAETCPPFDRRYVYHYPYPLDEARMIAAARLLEGERDFTSFAAADPVDGLGRSKVRRIFSSCLTREGDRLIYRVRGSGFLKHMVRNIVGVLLEVGKGNLGPADIAARLKPGCKIPSGPSAPPQGLFLVSVEYEEHVTRK